MHLRLLTPAVITDNTSNACAVTLTSDCCCENQFRRTHLWQVPELTLRWTGRSEYQAEGGGQADTGPGQPCGSETEPSDQHIRASGSALTGVEAVAGRERQLKAAPALPSQLGEAIGFDAKLPAAEPRDSTGTEAAKQSGHHGTKQGTSGMKARFLAQQSLWRKQAFSDLRQQADVPGPARVPGMAGYDGQRSQVVPLFGGGVFDSSYNTGRAPKRVPLPAGARRVLLVSVITGASENVSTAQTYEQQCTHVTARSRSCHGPLH